MLVKHREGNSSTPPHQGHWKVLHWGGAMWVENVKVLTDTEGVAVFPGKDNCLYKEAMPEKFVSCCCG